MKKVLSVFLAVILLFTVTAPACLAAEKAEQRRFPVIYVGPLGNADIYENPGTPEERVLFRPSQETVLSIAGQLFPAAIRLMLTHDCNAFGDVLIKSVNDAMGAMRLDGSGRPAADTAIKPEKPDDPNSDSYYFHYDWRLDPVEVAAQLREFTVYIKQLTGSKKVNFKASSMGGVVTMAYFNEYGSEDINACIFQCCPILGTAVAGDALCRKIKLDARATLDYGAGAFPPVDAGSLMLYFLFHFLYYSGMLDMVISTGEKVVDRLKDRVYSELMTPVFGTLLGLWSFVPADSYEQAKALNLDPETQAGLIAKADYYHYNIQLRADEILKSTADSGTKIMIVAGHGMQRTPLVESMDSDSDATVDVKYASAGAEAAKRGETLGKNYVQKVDDGKNHISPDRTLDASTCILPDNTWFIKGMLHANCHDGISEMYDLFMHTDTISDVWSCPRYPQFLLNDKPNKRLIPLGNFAEGVKPPETIPGKSFHDRYEKFAARTVNKIFACLDKARMALGNVKHIA